MKRCLTICPTRERVDKCREMLYSFYDTAKDSRIMFMIDADDPTLGRYIPLLEKRYYRNCIVDYMVCERSTTTNLINHAFQSNNDYEFYHLINDDFVYRTQGWDSLFIQTLEDYGPGIAYGNDLYMKQTLPVAPFISGEIARAVGWLQLPTLTHLCGDMVWKYIGDQLKCLYYHKDIFIDHKHPFSKEHNVAKDKTFERTNSKEMYNKDNAAFWHWLLNDSMEDIEKIKEAVK